MDIEEVLERLETVINDMENYTNWDTSDEDNWDAMIEELQYVKNYITSMGE
jgi:DNA-binding SARP family transcriptional activator